MDVSETKLRRKTFAQDFLTEDEGGAHVPPTKLFPRLAVNKTILKPRVAAIPVRGIFPT